MTARLRIEPSARAAISFKTIQPNRHPINSRGAETLPPCLLYFMADGPGKTDKY
jgi:hypothetical protein